MAQQIPSPNFTHVSKPIFAIKTSPREIQWQVPMKDCAFVAHLPSIQDQSQYVPSNLISLSPDINGNNWQCILL